MVRFHQLVIEPCLAGLEAGRARQVWAQAERTVESKIFGPHFETLAAQYAPGEAGLAVGPVGQTVIDELAAEAIASRGKILLVTLDQLYGQSS